MMGLFSFRGRTGRLGFWRVVLLCMALGAAAIAVGYVAVFALGPAGGIVFAAFAPLSWINVAAGVRRLHDRGRSAWWLLPFGLGPFACGVVAQGLIGHDSAVTAIESLPFSLASIGLLLWGLIEIGFRRGDASANRFGEAPPPGR